MFKAVKFLSYLHLIIYCNKVVNKKKKLAKLVISSDYRPVHGQIFSEKEF